VRGRWARSYAAVKQSVNVAAVCEAGAVSQQRMRATATATGAAQRWVMVVMVAEDTGLGRVQ
jgi:hypothetical protein